MKNKRIMIITVFTLVLISIIPAYADGPTLSLSCDKPSYLLDEEFSVRVIGNGLADIAGVDLAVTYDRSLLELVKKEIKVEEEIIDIQGLDGVAVERLEDSEGIGRTIFGLKKNSDLLNGNQVIIAEYTFKAIGLGETEIGFDANSSLIRESNNDGRMEYTHVTPEFEKLTINIIQKGDISGKISTSDGYQLSEPEVILTAGESTYEAEVDGEGNYSFSMLEDGIYTLTIREKGYEEYSVEITISEGESKILDVELVRIIRDVDRDGIVDLKDLVFVASRFELTNSQDGWSDDADINKDNVIDMLDILYISRVLE